MKTLFGIGFIILGIVTLFRYPNLGADAAETFGALIGIGLVTFLPGVLLIKSDNKNKTE
jgi:uncharacterized membrane protein YjjP (DUF1212 family)